MEKEKLEIGQYVVEDGEKMVHRDEKTEYYVKRYEEEMGDEICKVIVPNGTSNEEVIANFKKASTYAASCFWEYIDKDFDEHFDEMVDLRETVSGDEAFSYYLEHFCGYKCIPLFSGKEIVVHMQFPAMDFSYEW